MGDEASEILLAEADTTEVDPMVLGSFPGRTSGIFALAWPEHP